MIGFLLIVLFLFGGCASAPLEVITCTPPHADIYWGPTPTELRKSGHKTPFSREISGSEWKPWCYQVKKEGYHDSQIVCREREKSRYINFNLDPLIPTSRSEQFQGSEAFSETAPKPKPEGKEYVISGSRLTLTWDDASSDEAGFEIERKEGAEGRYRKIGTVGANVTEYTDSGLKPGGVYYYRVRAYNAKGFYSAYAAEIRVETNPK
jgi:hypothetical protein